MNTILKMQNVSKSFGGVHALVDVHLTVGRGEIHALMGENGAGKSTLMKCLFGVYNKDAGNIYLEGKEVNFKNSKEALENGVEEGERISSYYFWKVFREYEPEDSILALGNNTGNSSKLQIGVQKKEQRTLTNYTCGSMGYDLPAAVGAAVASGKKVFCVTGDGSIMMNLQELQTVVQYNLPVNLVVFSNDGYGAIRQTCKNFFNGAHIGCTPDSGVSFPSFEKTLKR